MLRSVAGWAEAVLPGVGCGHGGKMSWDGSHCWNRRGLLSRRFHGLYRDLDRSFSSIHYVLASIDLVSGRDTKQVAAPAD